MDEFFYAKLQEAATESGVKLRKQVDALVSDHETALSREELMEIILPGTLNCLKRGFYKDPKKEANDE